MSVPIALVAAMAENRVIGRDGGLPWRLADDLRWFKQVTLGKPVLMGRATWDSIGRPLPGRDNFVLSRRAVGVEGATVAGSLEAALAAARRSAVRSGAEEVCVIGGGVVYEQALPLAGRLYLTLVEAEVPGDAFFPALDPAGWAITERGRIAPGERNDHPARVELWERR